MPDIEDMELWSEGPSIDLIEEPTDPAALEEQIYDYIRTRWPDWEPADGNLEVWIAKAISLVHSDLYDLAGETADDVFTRFGELYGVTPFTAEPAVGETTWTAINDDGYTIEAGTEVAVAKSGNESVAFEVAETVIIPQGDTTGIVNIVAAEPGTDGNGLNSNVALIDALVWVDSITLTGPTHSGVDGEEIESFTARFSERLQTISETPIVPADFERIARTFFTFVGRAVARDGWNPGDNTDNNERMISLAVIAPDGEPLTTPQKNSVKAQLEAMREVNFVVHVIDATYTTIDVDYEIVPRAGFDMVDVRASVDEQLALFFSPANWGRNQIAGAVAEYRLEDTVRYFDVIALIDHVTGVDYVDDLKICKHGDSPGTADLSLSGAVPLTRAGTFS